MASHLASSLGLRAVSAAAVGNDYNDLDLLLWAGSGFVTGNAPAELRARFATVAGNDAAGVAEALRRWGGASAAAPPGKPFGV